MVAGIGSIRQPVLPRIAQIVSTKPCTRSPALASAQHLSPDAIDTASARGIHRNQGRFLTRTRRGKDLT
jgi:hypothetical protein